MARLEGKRAVITGGSGGIGLSIARHFVEEGAQVLLVDIEEDALNNAAAEIGGNKVFTYVADVSDEKQTQGYLNAAKAQMGGIDIYVPNAGIEGKVMPITDYPVDTFDKVLAVNVRGVWLGIKYVVPIMNEGNGGSIVVMSSVAGLRGSPGMSPYIASKHAINGIAKTAAQEFASMGIRVNTVNPGPIDTRMMRSIESGASPDAPDSVKSGFEEQVPLGRYGTPEEVALLTVFLASDESSYCTGGVYVVDGGFTAG